MKVNLFLRTVALVSLVVFASCRKDDDNNPSSPTTGPFVAKVDGKQFATDNNSAKAKFVSSTKMLQIIGQTADQTETIHFELLPFRGSVSSASDWFPGTYKFNPVHIYKLEYSASAMFTKYEKSEYINWNTKWEYVQNGEIKIESNTGTHIKGTFSFDVVKQNSNGTFDATNIKKVTEGSFDLDIVQY